MSNTEFKTGIITEYPCNFLSWVADNRRKNKKAKELFETFRKFNHIKNKTRQQFNVETVYISELSIDVVTQIFKNKIDECCNILICTSNNDDYKNSVKKDKDFFDGYFYNMDSETREKYKICFYIINDNKSTKEDIDIKWSKCVGYSIIRIGDRKNEYQYVSRKCFKDITRNLCEYIDFDTLITCIDLCDTEFEKTFILDWGECDKGTEWYIKHKFVFDF